MKKLSSFVLFTAFCAAVLAASNFCGTAMADSIPVIHLNDFPANQLLTAYYGNGLPPGVQEGGALPTIKNVYLGPITSIIGSDGTANLNAQTIAHPGVSVTNYVILLVTVPSQQSVYFENVNGTIPSFPGISNTQTLTANQFIREGIQYMNLFATPTSSDGSIALSYNPCTFNIGEPVPATQ